MGECEGALGFAYAGRTNASVPTRGVARYFRLGVVT
jgi:hypothetical protein